MTKAKPGQGARLIQLLMRRPMTYQQMLQASESTCPWKRVAEALHDGLELVKGQNSQGWTTWRVRNDAKNRPFKFFE